jgi:hypothetical protein
MSDGPRDVRTAWITAFVAAGVVTTVQELATLVLCDIEGVDPNLVAEETLCLVALSSARAVQAASDGSASLSAVSTVGIEQAASAILDLPFLYRDYVVGGAIIEDSDRDVDGDQLVYHRLARARAFYSVHFLPGEYPAPQVVEDKMALWMGRVSPPRLHELPVERLQRLKLAPRLNTHLRLVLEFARQSSSPDQTTNG